MDATRDYYERFSEEYVRKTFVMPPSLALRKFINLLPGSGLVVDLGCGSGRDLLTLASAGYVPVGVDYSLAMVSWAKQCSCSVIVGDIRKLPLRSACADGAWASASLLHLKRRDLASALSECYRLLKPGGVFAASVKLGVGEGEDATGRWFTYYEADEWRRSLLLAGFTVSGIELETGSSGDSPSITWVTSFSTK